MIRDKFGVAAVDPVTDLLKASAEPYWDGGILLRSDSTRTLYATVGGVQVALTAANVTAIDLDLQPGEVSSYPNFPDSGVTTVARLHTALIDYSELVRQWSALQAFIASVFES